MTQRKLTEDERQTVASASYFVSRAAGLSGGPGDCWRDALRQLGEMLNNGTTDGQPYVEPEPPILDGYRLAVAGDEGREDCKFWSEPGGIWKQRSFVGRDFEEGSHSHYIVPVDVTPTDEEAKSRPEVMVRDGSEPWHKAVLYGVLTNNAYSFLVVSRGTSGRFKYARHLYPGE